MTSGQCAAAARQGFGRNTAFVICVVWPVFIEASSVYSGRARILQPVEFTNETVRKNASTYIGNSSVKEVNATPNAPRPSVTTSAVVDSNTSLAVVHDHPNKSITVDPVRVVPSQLRAPSRPIEVPATANSGNLTQRAAEVHGKPEPLFNTYFFMYWGTVAFVFCVIFPLIQYFISEDDEDEIGVRQLKTVMRVNSSRSSVGNDSARHHDTELSGTVWALNLVAAAGQARFTNGWRVPVYLVSIISVSVGVLQCTILWILVHEINPATRPISEHWTVNCMKWCMVLVISMTVVGDLEECKGIVLAIYKIDTRDLYVGRWLPAIVAVWQYLISVYVVRAGVQVVLSFEKAPDIVYSSLAITFLTNIDNLAFSFLETVFNLDVDFAVKLGDMRPLPTLFSSLVTFFGLFPMLLGFFLTGRAYLFNEMFTISGV